jgi:hypothetical protein
LLASAQHWLEWRLDRLLAPLTAAGALPALATLQAIERDGQALVQQLPEGVLRQRGVQRLAQALQAPAGWVASAATRSQPLQLPLAALTARQRAERRVLRLFIHAPACRELLSCLALQDPACRVALEWLRNLALVAADGAISTLALQLAEHVTGAAGALIAQAAAPGPDVIAVLQREPQAELQVLLDGLEPVVPQVPVAAPGAVTKRQQPPAGITISSQWNE